MFYDLIHISCLTSSKEASLKAVKLSQSMMRYPVEYERYWRVISFGSAKIYHNRRPTFKLKYLKNHRSYKKATYIFWKFRNLSFMWLWFHIINLIPVWTAEFWKKVSKIMGFYCLQKLPIFSIFDHFKKMLNFERL